VKGGLPDDRFGSIFRLEGPLVTLAMRDFSIGLRARLEGLEYREGDDVYRFGMAFKGDRWVVYLPGSKGDQYEMHQLTESERIRILPRVKAYLESRRRFGLVGATYPATFEPTPPLPDDVLEAQRSAADRAKNEPGTSK
jgi:hypothetical protein